MRRSYREWCQIASCIKIPKELRNLSSAEAIKSVSAYTGVNFPIPTGYFYPDKTELHLSLRFALAWYKLRGTDVKYSKVELTSEQKEIIKVSNVGIVAVNAGPGTGKTTTIVEIIKSHITGTKHGILVICYQNSVLAHIRKLLLANPQLSKCYKVDDFSDKRITLMTIDRLASFCVGGIVGYNFEDNIQKACSALDDEHMKLNIARMFYSISNYCHSGIIIIDEANMINDIRGNFIMKLYGLINACKTLFVLGDPRQSISNESGTWFKALLEKDIVKTLVLSITHRFKTSKMLCLANALSEKRPDIHVKLITETDIDNEKPSHYLIVKHMSEIDDVIDKIKSYGSKYGFSKIAIIAPSLNRQNKSSVAVRTMINALSVNGIMRANHGENNYISNGVFVGTINASSGREYDLVFLVGFSGFPESYRHVSYDAGNSLLYVACTRASKRTYIICDTNFIMPRGLELDYFDDTSKLDIKEYTPTYEEPKHFHYTLDNLFENVEATDFFMLNGMEIKKKKLVKMVIGSIDMYYMIKYLTGKHPSIFDLDVYEESMQNIVSNIKCGKTIYGITRGKVYATPEAVSNSEILHSALGLQVPESSLDKLRLAAEKILEVIGELDTCEPRGVNNIWAWALAKNSTYVVVANEDSVYCLLVGNVYKVRTVIQITAGGIYILNTNLEYDYLDFLLASAIEISCTIENINFIRRLKEARDTYKPSKYISSTKYTVDTEFINVYKSSAIIFNIAIVNTKNPFRSVVQLMYVEDKYKERAAKHLDMAVSLLENSPEEENVCNMIRALLQYHEKDPTIYYHMCKIDLQLLPENIKPVNTMDLFMPVVADIGTFNSTQKTATLGDISHTMGIPFESLVIGREHTALTDSLMLLRLLTNL